MDKKRVLTHLVKAGRDALHLEATLKSIGYEGTPYFDLYGEIADAVYEMLGEETETIDESITYAAMHDIYTSDEMCAERLAELCEPEPCRFFGELPETTLSILTEAADRRGMDLQTLAKLIVCEWSAREILHESLAGK